MADQAGWVYILSNPALPGVVKIGFTQTSPEGRCDAFNRSMNLRRGQRFVLEWVESFDDCRDAERAVHYLLDDFRVNEREFFKVDVEEAKRVIAEVRRLGVNWKPEGCRLSMVRRSSVSKVSRRTRRLRNRFLYDWLVSNFDTLIPRIGHLSDEHSTDPLFTEVLQEWRSAMGPDYKARRVSELGLAMEWGRVVREVTRLREFGDREVLWEVCPTPFDCSLPG
jgi:plasmid stabilization system protein ParE